MICLPIIERDVNKAIKVAEEYLKLADLVEFRIDYLNNISEKDIEEMSKYPAIITIRLNGKGVIGKVIMILELSFLRKLLIVMPNL